MQRTTISDDKSLTVELLDFGARIHRISFEETELALSYSKLSDYLTDPYYLGASVGPIANRIAGGKLCIDGVPYQMPLNDGDNSLHSGGSGFDKETWGLINANRRSAEYELIFDMNRIGLAGRLIINAYYSVENGALTIKYHAKSDTLTYINPTNHVYLNLSGTGNIADHHFEIPADNYVVVDECSLPTGELTRLSAPLDYEILNSPLSAFTGLVDHHFNMGMRDDDETQAMGEALTPMLMAESDTSGIRVLISGNSPGFQFYTGKFLSKPFLPSAGFCVETQFAPDSINQPGFYAPLLAPNQEHQQQTVLAFSSSNQ